MNRLHRLCERTERFISVVVHMPPGIIPAHAGNTTAAAKPNTCDRDHPRACGEHRLIDSSRIGLSGSSPRMRGTPPIIPKFDVHEGIIPAHAGNTSEVEF